MEKTKGSHGLKAFIAIIFLGVVTTAHAKKPKISILHCGVDEVAETMVYKAISVSKASISGSKARSKGHGNHVFGSIDSVGTGEFAENEAGITEEVFVDYVRNSDDCLINGDGNDDSGLPTCKDLGKKEGDLCGMILESAM